MLFRKKKVPQPQNEAERLAFLKALNVLDSAPDVRFTDLVEVSAQIARTPISVLSLIDQDRQWFKAKHGLSVDETPREAAFCTHTILNEKGNPLIVRDSFEDMRFSENPLVLGDPKIRFYAGFPLVMFGQYSVGSLCVIDREPRELSPAQIEGLSRVAEVAIRRLECLSPEIRSQALEMWFKRA